MNNINLESYYKTNISYYNLLKTYDITTYEKYMKFLRPSRGKNILEFGCGAGQVINKLTEEGYNAIGIDISPLAVETARNSGNGFFHIIDSNKLPFNDNYFDSVGTIDVLEHLYDPENWLREMIRVLKPNGIIVIACPNFLRVCGINAHHWHTKGLLRKIINSFNLLRKFKNFIFFPDIMKFDFMEPRVDLNHFQPDDDAVCITNPIDISFILKKYGITIKYQSSLYQPSSYFIGKLSEFPIIRTIAGGVFFAGIKK